MSDEVPPPFSDIRDPPCAELLSRLTHAITVRKKHLSTIENIDKLMHEGELFASSKYFIMSYCPPLLLTDLLNKCNFFAYIYHDKDDGVIPHYHYYISFSMNKNLFKLAEEFHCGEYSFMCENVRSRKASLRYLIHIDYPEKAQYALGCVVSNNFESVERACRSSASFKEDNEGFIKDMFRLNAYELGCKYGRDFIKNYKNYASFCASLSHCMQFVPVDENGCIDDELNEEYHNSFAYTYSGALGYNPYKIEGVKSSN